MTAPFVADAEALQEALAEPLARALGEFHNNPEWTSLVGSVGLDDEPAFRAAQGRREEQEEERQAQTEAMRWALEQPAVINALASVVQPREDAVREAAAAALRDAAADWTAGRPGGRQVDPWLRARAAALGGGGQCDESCHEENRDECPRCDSLDWERMCDSCRSYAAQDAEPAALASTGATTQGGAS